MFEVAKTTVDKMLQDLRGTHVERSTRRVFYRGTRTRCIARPGSEKEVEQRLKECICLETDREAMGKPFDRPMNLMCRLTEWFTDGTERGRCRNEDGLITRSPSGTTRVKFRSRSRVAHRGTCSLWATSRSLLCARRLRVTAHARTCSVLQ